MQSSDFPRVGIRLIGDRICRLCLTKIHICHHINHIQAPLKSRTPPPITTWDGGLA